MRGGGMPQPSGQRVAMDHHVQRRPRRVRFVSLMVQATVQSGLGLLFTPWRFDTPLVLAGAATMAAIAYLLWLLRTNRLTAGRLAATTGFYLTFAVASSSPRERRAGAALPAYPGARSRRDWPGCGSCLCCRR